MTTGENDTNPLVYSHKNENIDEYIDCDYSKRDINKNIDSDDENNASEQIDYP